MGPQIEDKSRPAFEGQRPTWRREHIRASKAADASHLRQVRAALLALADAWEAGTIPDLLRGLTTKIQVEELLSEYVPEGRISRDALRQQLERAKGKPGVAAARATIESILRRSEPPHAHMVRLYGMDEVKAVERLYRIVPQDRPRGFDSYRRMLQAGITETTYPAAHQALLDLLDPRSGQRSRAAEIADREREVMLHKIPGFFPTPAPVIARMLEEAHLSPSLRVLEPSAGSGAIADAVRAAGAKVECVEINWTLRELLALKGHALIDTDFMQMEPEARFDRVLMNPPFEQKADIAHVRRAYGWLKPGGILVAIMSEGTFFRSDSASRGFQEWLEECGWSEPLPDGSFKESGTGVATRLVVIRK